MAMTNDVIKVTYRTETVTYLVTHGHDAMKTSYRRQTARTVTPCSLASMAAAANVMLTPNIVTDLVSQESLHSVFTLLKRQKSFRHMGASVFSIASSEIWNTPVKSFDTVDHANICSPQGFFKQHTERALYGKKFVKLNLLLLLHFLITKLPPPYNWGHYPTTIFLLTVSNIPDHCQRGKSIL